MIARRFPKVLFISPCAFNHITGGGVTFSNLFKGWPQERLATVHNDRVPVSKDVCSMYFQLQDEEINWIYPFDKLKQFLGITNTDSIQSQQATKTWIKNILLRMPKMILGDAGIPDRGRLSPRLQSWIEAYNPDIIYTILGTIGHLELVEEVKTEFKLPLAIHLMDDGVTDPQRKGIFGDYARRIYNKKFRELLPRADIRMGICEKMCQAYELRYGYPFIPFQNSVDIAKWSGYSKTNISINGPVKIVYMGSILPQAQIQSLIDCCHVVDELQREGMDLRLDIYTPLSVLGHHANYFSNLRSVYIHDAVVNDDVYFRILGEADILLLPVNFDSKSVHYIYYSMPAKVPSYLCSGTPILVYGPQEVAQIEYASQRGWGYVVTKRDLMMLKRAILELSRNNSLRKTISEKAVAAAKENHDSTKVRELFQRRLVELIKHE